jgi:membrane protein implicated in regulation of membrane protease activity
VAHCSIILGGNMNGTVAALVVLLGLAYTVLMVWFVVISVRFLRTGRKAFTRYLELTEHQARGQQPGASPAWPTHQP